jgi:uncharacterized damage-inducible protein DinB
LADRWDLPIMAGLEGELATLAAALQDGTREWRKELGVVGRDALRYRSRDDGRSIGALLLHLADCEDYWIQEVAGGRKPDLERRAKFLSEETNQYGGVWPDAPKLSLTEYYAMMDEVRAETLALLPTLGPPDRVVVRPGGTKEFTLRWILVHLIQHEPYHAGQCVLLKDQYLRSR